MSFGIPVRNGLAVGLLASTFLSSRRAAYPAMSLDFLQPFLDSRITFSRGSNATLVDATGKITYAPANLLTYSQEFDNAAWTKTNCTAASTTLTTDPIGGTSADIITLTGATAQKHLLQTTTASSGSRAFSVYAKAGSHNFIQLMFDGGSAYANFNVSSGVKGDVASGTSDIQSIGNGWYRLTLISSSTGNGRIYGVDSNTATWAASSSSTGTFYIWGAQLEPVTYQTTPSTYVATTASAYYGPRFDYDPVTLAPKGLLIEEARTNLLTYSEQFDNAAWLKNATTVVANSTLAPSGVIAADTLQADGTSAQHYVGQTGAVSGVAYTFSVFAKAGTASFLNIQITGANLYAQWNVSTGALVFSGAGTGTLTATSQTNFGNGWYRLSVAFTQSSGSDASVRLHVLDASSNAANPVTSSTGNVYIYGAQLEAGSFATSYIPTVASTVTRSADVATMTGTNFSSWYNQSEGTFVSDWDAIGYSSNNMILAVSDSGTTNLLQQYLTGSTSPRFLVRTSGVDQAVLDSTSGATTVNKMASAYKANDFASTVNGATAATDATGTIPVVDRLGIGSRQASLIWNGHIRSIDYIPTRIADFQLQALTT